MNYLQTGRQILMEMNWTVIRECRSVTEDSVELIQGTDCEIMEFLPVSVLMLWCVSGENH